VTRQAVSIDVEPAPLPGDLVVPEGSRGVVVFAHGSGSSRRSPRNVAVADSLNRTELSTLLFDLLTPEEAEDRSLVFDVDLLATRLEAAARWVREVSGLGDMPLAFFGASTGAAAALVAATRPGNEVSSIVSRGGRPDLAGEALERVTTPTLLIVGSEDRDVLELNHQAERRIRAETRLEVIPGAGHLFEEPGALETVAELAATWIERNLERVRTEG
jgi:putative phosphoribosyl transferase